MTVAAATENTFPKLLIRNARLFADRPAFRHKDLGIWQTWTWGQVLERGAGTSLGLQHSVSSAATRSRSSAPTGRSSTGRSCAAQALGAVPVPVYADAVADEMAYVLDHAEVTLRRRRGPGAGRQGPPDLRPAAEARTHRL